MTEKDFLRYCSAQGEFKFIVNRNLVTTSAEVSPESFVKTVDDWCEKHPLKTYAEDFLSKFPNAHRDLDGEPICCRNNVYFNGKICDRTTDCHKCWFQEIEE